MFGDHEELADEELRECVFCGEPYRWDEVAGVWVPQCMCLDDGGDDESEDPGF